MRTPHDDDPHSNMVLRGDNEVGVASVSSNLFSNVTRYHAQIGASVPRDTLQQLEWNLLSEAKTLFHQRKFEEALNTFTHCLAVTEKTRSAKDHAVRGAVIHNIASCLHNLGEMEAAQAYYEQAIEAFKKAYTPLMERAIYGDANKRRIEFVKERLVDISWGRKPDGDKYLDENGNKRPVAPVFGESQENGEQQLSDRWRAPTDAEEPGLPSWAAAARGMDGGSAPAPRYEAQLMSAPRHYYDDPPIRHDAHGHYTSQDAPQVPQQHDDHGRQHFGHEPERPAAGSALAGRADTYSNDEDDAAQEAARKEWLQYHMQVGEWDKAEELVVTAEEREDLEYLMEKQRRERATGSAAISNGPTSRAEGFGTHVREHSMAQRGQAPPLPEPKLIDDDDGML